MRPSDRTITCAGLFLLTVMTVLAAGCASGGGSGSGYISASYYGGYYGGTGCLSVLRR